ncbi:TetR/AcrR family transcriptional regulator [Paenibacillus segetis]|uniref:TetR family transcriptional regulator n=1 Tax=Paenibacillus segetis TaxID=1325360 RepID=A0ABQ1YLX5_9BACL|nr:TetR/AcrR family transcriptional regulator [Paenibacillus segetis]GGH30983.1 TetR family transcriptional regulator [Paenibacillus segetis]
MQKDNRRTNKSKKELKNALISLIEKKSFQKITITDIVNCADLNRGTFYKHYQTKEELLTELIDDVMDDLVKSYKEPYLHTDKLKVSELTASSIRIFEHVASYSNFYLIIVNSNVLPGFQNKICDILKQLVQYNSEDITAVNEDINSDLFSSYSAYALFGLIMEWVRGGFKYTSEYMAEQLIKIVTFNLNHTTNTPE